jgi:EAL domain-containing protein (putative c-di-GMP-specific phosphodiesterase class I)
MPAHDPATRQQQQQHLWALQLPQRMERLRRRADNLAAAWDINVLRLLADDASQLASASQALGAARLAEVLSELHAACASLLDPPRAPDRANLARLEALIRKLATQNVPSVREDAPPSSDVHVPGSTRDLGFPLLTTPPPSYWNRFQKEAAVATAVPAPAAPASAPAPTTEAAPPTPSVAVPPPPVPAERAAFAPRAFSTPAASACSREQLLRQVSECLALDDAAIRGGGVLLFVAADGTRDHASEAQRSTETIRLLCMHANPGDRVAADGPGRFLLFNRELDATTLETYAQRLRERIAREPILAGAAPAPALFDVGICPFGRGARHARAMHEAARGAVGGAHAQGRHGVFVVRDVNAATDGKLVDLVSNALESNAFEILFQPIVSLRGDGAQFQALLRVRGDDGRLHAASEIVPAAESAGLIGAVDRWVVEHCIAQIAQRRDKAAMHLFVSQSLASVRDAQGPAWLQATLARHGVGAGALVLELRAADATDAPADVQRYLTTMRALGVQLALSGLDEELADVHPLPSLQVEFVKLAPRVPNADAQAARESFIALVERLHERGSKVIAARVEDARGAAELWSTGVDMIQGNFVQAADQNLAFDFGGTQV